MITRESLQAAAQGASNLFPGSGFILIAIPSGEDDPVAQYCSNLKREDAIKAMKEILFRWGHNDEWMQNLR